MSLPFLVIPPDSTGYRAVDGNTFVNSGPLDGGLSRSRADVDGAAITCDVQWTLNPLAYEYLQAFKRDAITNGADTFQIMLVFDAAEPTLYTVKLAPNTFGLRTQTGTSYVVVATLEVAPRTPDPFFDESLIGVYTAYGEGTLSMLDLISDLVSISFPDFV